MMFTPWETAHGEAEPAWLSVGRDGVVALSPADDSVDTNDVIIEGAGTINSFGESPHKVIKRVKFVPLVLKEMDERALPTIILSNSPSLNLLSGQQRSISKVSYGMYHCDGQDHWIEVYFVQQGSALVTELEERLAKLEAAVYSARNQEGDAS
jgi:hypothetical protein